MSLIAFPNTVDSKLNLQSTMSAKESDGDTEFRTIDMTGSLIVSSSSPKNLIKETQNDSSPSPSSSTTITTTTSSSSPNLRKGKTSVQREWKIRQDASGKPIKVDSVTRSVYNQVVKSVTGHYSSFFLQRVLNRAGVETSREKLSRKSCWSSTKKRIIEVPGLSPTNSDKTFDSYSSSEIIDEELGNQEESKFQDEDDDDEQKKTSTKNFHQPDPNFILSLERTLFAALNNAWLLAMGGVGLMSVGNNDPIPLFGGIGLVGMAISVTMFALLMHFSRIHQVKTGKTFQYSQTVLWVAFIGIGTLVTMGLTLYYGIVYPFLKRTAAVEVTNVTGDFDAGSL